MVPVSSFCKYNCARTDPLPKSPMFHLIGWPNLWFAYSSRNQGIGTHCFPIADWEVWKCGWSPGCKGQCCIYWYIEEWCRWPPRRECWYSDTTSNDTGILPFRSAILGLLKCSRSWLIAFNVCYSLIGSGDHPTHLLLWVVGLSGA